MDELEDFICPILQEVMIDPVITTDGIALKKKQYRSGLGKGKILTL